MRRGVFKLLIAIVFALLIVVAVRLALGCLAYASLIVQAAEAFVLTFILLIGVFTYLESRDPVVSFYIEPTTPDSGPELRTFVVMRNHSAFNTAVWVNLNLKIDGVIQKVGAPKYTGDEPWNLQAGFTVSGTRFEPGEAIKKQIGKDASTIKNELATGAEPPKITIEIKIWHTASLGTRVHKPVQKWHFDFKRYKWIFDV